MNPTLLGKAWRAGLVITVDDNGLVVRGGRRHAELVKSLLAEEKTLARWLAHPAAICLDWSGSGHVGRTTGTCRHCDRPAWLVNDSGQHAHKVCEEAAVADLLDRLGAARPVAALTPSRRTGDNPE